MATLIANDKEIEIPDESPIKPACKKLGVPFSCEDGDCGTCMIEVEEGMENLSEKSDPEKAMGIVDGNYRLACQCRIKKGKVKIFC